MNFRYVEEPCGEYKRTDGKLLMVPPDALVEDADEKEMYVVKDGERVLKFGWEEVPEGSENLPDAKPVGVVDPNSEAIKAAGGSVAKTQANKDAVDGKKK